MVKKKLSVVCKVCNNLLDILVRESGDWETGEKRETAYSSYDDSDYEMPEYDESTPSDTSRVGDETESDTKRSDRNPDFGPEENADSNPIGSTQLHESAKSLKASVRQNCMMCKLFQSHLKADDYPRNISWFPHDRTYMSGNTLDMMRWGLKINESKDFQLCIRSNDRDARMLHSKHNKLLIKDKTYDEVTYSGSAPCLNLVRKWIDVCKNEHNKPNNGRGLHRDDNAANGPRNWCTRYKPLDYWSWLPTRLISCPKDENPRLVASTELATKKLEYMTLSHCWGRIDGRMRLTQENLEAWKGALPKEQLEQMKTFHDAIQIAQACDITYLWIDSLCIIQDDYDDLAQELSVMDRVYMYSTCTISATDAEDDRVGCFFPRGRPYVTFRTDIRPKKTRENTPKELWDIHIYRTNDHRELRDGVTHSRAWIVQERILSPRMVYFCRNQLFWECDYCTASERLPAGESELRRTDHDKEKQVAGRERVKIFQNGAQAIPGNNYAIQLPEALFAWIGIRNLFWKTKITHRKDALNAVSAIAREIKRKLNVDYFAGIFQAEVQEHTMYQLYWISKDVESDLRESDVAPSWSWASAIGTGAKLDDDDGPFSKATALARFVMCRPRLDVYGQASHGSVIEVRGALCPVFITPKNKIDIILNKSIRDTLENQRQERISDDEDWVPEYKRTRGWSKPTRLQQQITKDGKTIKFKFYTERWTGLRVKYDVPKPPQKEYYFLPLLFTGQESYRESKYFLRGLALERLGSGNYRRIGLIQGKIDVAKGSLFRVLVGRQDGYGQVAVKPWPKKWSLVIIE